MDLGSESLGSIGKKRRAQAGKIQSVIAKNVAGTNKSRRNKSKGDKSKGKRSGPWGVKQVLATPFAPTLPPIITPTSCSGATVEGKIETSGTGFLSGTANAIEALRLACAQLAHTAAHRARTDAEVPPSKEVNKGGDICGEGTCVVGHEASPASSEIKAKGRPDSKSEQTKPRVGRFQKDRFHRKPYGLLVGINEVTRALERRVVSVVALARDTGSSILISHIPALCAASRAHLVAVADDGSKLGAAIGLRSALVVAILRGVDANTSEAIVEKALPPPLKDLADLWIRLSSPLNFPWLLPNESCPRDDNGSASQIKLEFQRPVLIPHRNKARREILGVPPEETGNDENKSE